MSAPDCTTEKRCQRPGWSHVPQSAKPQGSSPARYDIVKAYFPFGVNASICASPVIACSPRRLVSWPFDSIRYSRSLPW